MSAPGGPLVDAAHAVLGMHFDARVGVASREGRLVEAPPGTPGADRRRLGEGWLFHLASGEQALLAQAWAVMLTEGLSVLATHFADGRPVELHLFDLEREGGGVLLVLTGAGDRDLSAAAPVPLEPLLGHLAEAG